MDATNNICDSVATCMNGGFAGYQPIIRVAETNCADVEIVETICGTVLIFAVVLAVVCLIWHCVDVSAKKELGKNDRLRNKQLEKTDTEQAKDIFSYIVGQIKTKEGDIDKGKVNELYGIYKTIRSDFANGANNQNS